MEDVIAKKIVGEKLVHVLPLTYGRAQIAIGPKDEEYYDDLW